MTRTDFADARPTRRATALIIVNWLIEGFIIAAFLVVAEGLLFILGM